MEEDYYKILGVDKNASADEIKRAYKKTAIKYHPDKNPGDKNAEEMFKKAAEAYDVLRDPDKRARYDQFGKAGVEGMGGAGGFGSGGMDINDIFAQFGDIFGDMGFGFGGGFGRSNRRGGAHRPAGNDLRLKVKLSLRDIATGTTKKFRVKKQVHCSHCGGTGADGGAQPETCPQCHGTGYTVRTRQSFLGVMQTQEICDHCHGEGTVITRPCSYCHGEGTVQGEEIVEVKIPAGVANGMIINVPGKGNAGRHGGPSGDIQLIVEEEPHPDFIRDEQDLIYNLLLTVPQATLGDAVEIPTIDGKARINIKPGTQPGTTLRLRGKGLPAVSGYGYGVGDIIVNVSVYIPENLQADEKRIFEQMKSSPSMTAPQTIKDKIFSAFRKYF